MFDGLGEEWREGWVETILGKIVLATLWAAGAILIVLFASIV